MTLNISSESIIACICEGGAETAIMNILLDNNLLIFNRDQLIDRNPLPRISVKDFERRYLRVDYEQSLLILRVIDSRSEKFNLSKAYRGKADIIDVITAPEIEILILVSMGKYDEYCRSGAKKPSDYCKSILKIENVKSQKFIKEYFSDPEFLVESIKEYHRVHKQKNTEASLYDLLNSSVKQ